MAAESPCIIDNYTPAPVVPDFGSAAPVGEMDVVCLLTAVLLTTRSPLVFAVCLVLVLVLFVVVLLTPGICTIQRNQAITTITIRSHHHQQEHKQEQQQFPKTGGLVWSILLGAAAGAVVAV